MTLATVEPGSPETPGHIGDFGQIQFIRDDALDLDAAGQQYRTTRNDLVLPAGVPHHNLSNGPDPEAVVCP